MAITQVTSTTYSCDECVLSVTVTDEFTMPRSPKGWFRISVDSRLTALVCSSDCALDAFRRFAKEIGADADAGESC